MKYSSSYTDIDGITTTLTVQIGSDASKYPLEFGEASSIEQNLSEIFDSCLPEMQKVHLQSHREVSRSLLSASCNILKDEVSRLQNSTEDQAA